jgi:hypothetical protein
MEQAVRLLYTEHHTTKQVIWCISQHSSILVLTTKVKHLWKLRNVKHRNHPNRKKVLNAKLCRHTVLEIWEASEWLYFLRNIFNSTYTECLSVALITDHILCKCNTVFFLVCHSVLYFSNYLIKYIIFRKTFIVVKYMSVWSLNPPKNNFREYVTDILS